MSNHTPDSFLPEKCRILSGSALKMIAMMTMLIDHTGMAILSQLPEAQIPLFSFLGNPVSLYRLSRDIGRVAFPIFCFCWQKDFCTQKIVSAMEEIYFCLRYFLSYPGIIFTQTHYSTKNKMCFLHYSSGILVFAQ